MAVREGQRIIDQEYERLFEESIGQFGYDLEPTNRRNLLPLDRFMFRNRWNYVVPAPGVDPPDDEQERIFLKEFIERVRSGPPPRARIFSLEPAEYEDCVAEVLWHYENGPADKDLQLYNSRDIIERVKNLVELRRNLRKILKKEMVPPTREDNPLLEKLHSDLVRVVNEELANRRAAAPVAPAPPLPAFDPKPPRVRT